jgi:hypothetical protein
MQAITLRPPPTHRPLPTAPYPPPPTHRPLPTAPYPPPPTHRPQCLTPCVMPAPPPPPLQVGGGISIMAEAQDLTLEQPRTEAEARLVQQLQVGAMGRTQGQRQADAAP